MVTSWGSGWKAVLVSRPGPQGFGIGVGVAGVLGLGRAGGEGHRQYGGDCVAMARTATAMTENCRVLRFMVIIRRYLVSSSGDSDTRGQHPRAFTPRWIGRSHTPANAAPFSFSGLWPWCCVAPMRGCVSYRTGQIHSLLRRRLGLVGGPAAIKRTIEKSGRDSGPGPGARSWERLDTLAMAFIMGGISAPWN